MGGDNDNILIIHYIDCIVPIPTFKIIFPELYTGKGREIHPMVLHINLLPYKTNMFVCYLCIGFSLEIIINMNIIIQGAYTLWVCKSHIIIPPTPHDIPGQVSGSLHSYIFSLITRKTQLMFSSGSAYSFLTAPQCKGCGSMNIVAEKNSNETRIQQDSNVKREKHQ